MMTRAFCLVSCIALLPATALAATLGTLHKGGTSVAFSLDGRALVIKQRGGRGAGEYQILRCEVLASRAGHVLTLRSLGSDFDYMPSHTGASGDDSTDGIKTLNWPYNSADEPAASAIVKAVSDRTGCE